MSTAYDFEEWAEDAIGNLISGVTFDQYTLITGISDAEITTDVVTVFAPSSVPQEQDAYMMGNQTVSVSVGLVTHRVDGQATTSTRTRHRAAKNLLRALFKTATFATGSVFDTYLTGKAFRIQRAEETGYQGGVSGNSFACEFTIEVDIYTKVEA